MATWKMLDVSQLPTNICWMSNHDRMLLYEKSVQTFTITSDDNSNNSVKIEGLSSPKLASILNKISFISEIVTILFVGTFQFIFFFPILWHIYGLYLLSILDYFKLTIFVIIELFLMYYPHKLWPRINDNPLFFNVIKYFSFRLSFPPQTQEYLLKLNKMDHILHSSHSQSHSHSQFQIASNKTENKNKNTNSKLASVIFIGMPHGIQPLAVAMGRLVTHDLFGKQFVGAAADIVLKLPILRTFMSWWGVISVSKKSLIKHLNNGISVGLVPDGISGMFVSAGANYNGNDKNDKNDKNKNDKDNEYVLLKNRKGVSKLALETGSNVLPCYGFGNTIVYDAWYDPWGYMQYLSKKLRMSIIMFSGRWGMITIPKKVPLYCVIGHIVENPYANTKIANPTKEQIDEYHEMILKEIKHIFDCHKHLYGWSHKKLVFL